MSTILVIEDEKGLLQIIKQALTDCGYVVETAGDGLDGIRKFDKGVEFLILTKWTVNHFQILEMKKTVKRYADRLTVTR